MFQEAETAFNELKAAAEALSSQMDGFAQRLEGFAGTLDAQSKVLVDISRRLEELEKASPVPVPVPAPPPAARPVRQIITEEMAKVSRHVLTEPQMLGWITHFTQPDYVAMNDVDFRAAVNAMALRDWGPNGIYTPKDERTFVVVSGESQ